MIFSSAVKTIAESFTFLEGPVWHKDGYLLFSDIPESTIYRWCEDEGLSVWRSPSNQSNGLTIDPEGCLIACEHEARRVSRTNPDGSVVSIADHYQNQRLNSPNDCVSRSDGIVYFTDPPYGTKEEERELPFNGVFRVLPGSSPILLTKELDRPNGLAFTPDESHLYIADTQQEEIHLFRVTADGDLEEGRVFAKVGRPDGMKVDVEGNLYAMSTEGIVVLDPKGNRLETIELPQRPANCAFGGSDYKTLYITARTSLYQIQTHRPGVSHWR